MTPSTPPRTTTLRPGRRPASVHSDNALQRVYDRGGPELLRRVLVALRDAYDGDPMAFESVVDDLGLVFDLYPEIDRAVLVSAPAKARHGVYGSPTPSRGVRERLGRQRPHRVAAAVVDA